jgi:hypothetical protein
MRFRPVLHLLTVSFMSGLICSAQETQPPYRNPKLTVGERAADLLQYGSTIFPQVLGLASTWDPEVVQQARC